MRWTHGLRVCAAALALIACAPPGANTRPASGEARTDTPASAVGGAGGPAASGAPPRVALKYGLNTPTVNVAPVWVAKEQGIFAKYGLDVELVTMSADLLVASLISGELPLTNLATTPLLNAALGGADIAFYGGYENVLRFWFYSRPEITSVRELRGKQVAITGRGGVVRRATELTFERNGRSPEGDVTLVATGNLNNSLTALLSGSVAAAMLAPPVSFRAQDEGMRLLVDTRDYHYPTLLSGIAGNRQWVARNEDATRRLLQAIGEGVAFAIQNGDRTKAIIAQYTGSDDAVLIERSYQVYAEVWERSLTVPLEAIRLDLESIAQENPAARTARPEQFYDNRFAEALEREGFFQRLYQ